MPIKNSNELNLSVLAEDKTSNQVGALKKLRDSEWQMCADNFFYFLTYVLTMDEDSGQIRPFPINYDYLQEIDHLYEHHQKLVILKSRRLLVSWYAVTKMLWGAFFSGTPGFRYTIYRGGIGSKNEDTATYMLDRVRFVIKNLPDWMQDRCKITTNNRLMIAFENDSVLQAFPMQDEGPHGYGFTDFLFDEIAYQPAARSTWAGLVPTLGAKGHILAVSTPNGKANFFFELWQNENNSLPGVHRHTIHWTANPEHDQEWFRKATAGMTKQMIEQQYNLSFLIYGGKPVFGEEFDYQTHTVEETKIIKTVPVLLGWDFGYHFPAFSVWQYNSLDQFVGHGELQGYDMSFDRFAKNCKLFAQSLYPRENHPEIHCVDPAGFQHYHTKGVSGAQSDVHEIKLAWKLNGKEPQIRPGTQDIGTRNNEGPRLKEMRKLFALRADGRPGIVISRNMKMFIEGLQGGYCYDEKGGEVPLKTESCVPLSAEILTVDGWRTYNQISIGDTAYGLDTEKRETVETPITAINVHEGGHELIRWYSNEIDFPVTKAHRHLIENRQKKFRYITPENLKQGHRLVSPPAMWSPPKRKKFTDKFIRIAAWVMAEGWYDETDGSIGIAQSENANPGYCKYLKELFAGDPCVDFVGTRTVRSRYRSDSVMSNWKIYRELAYLLRHFMPTNEKVPSMEFIRMMSNKDRRLFLYEFMRADGHAYNGKSDGDSHIPHKTKISRNKDFFVSKYTHKIVQVSKNRIDALQAIATLCGLNTSLRYKKACGIRGANMWSLSILHNRTRAEIGNMKHDTVYADSVWCPTTGTGNWVCRINGRIFVTGNSHLQDTAQYVVTAFNRMYRPSEKQAAHEVRRKARLGMRTGI